MTLTLLCAHSSTPSACAVCGDGGLYSPRADRAVEIVREMRGMPAVEQTRFTEWDLAPGDVVTIDFADGHEPLTLIPEGHARRVVLMVSPAGGGDGWSGPLLPATQTEPPIGRRVVWGLVLVVVLVAGFWVVGRW